MQSFLILAALAATALAFPAQNLTTREDTPGQPSVYMCKQPNWAGGCFKPNFGVPQVRSGSCINVKDVQMFEAGETVRAFGPDPGTVCHIFPQKDCTSLTMETVKGGCNVRTPGIADTASIEMGGGVVSFKCERDDALHHPISGRTELDPSAPWDVPAPPPKPAPKPPVRFRFNGETLKMEQY